MWKQAPVGTATGIGRSVFSVAFGVAPASTIALYAVMPWLPLALMAATAAGTALFFGALVAARRADPMPPAARPARRALREPPPHEPAPDKDAAGVPSTEDVSVRT